MKNANKINLNNSNLEYNTMNISALDEGVPETSRVITTSRKHKKQETTYFNEYRKGNKSTKKREIPPSQIGIQKLIETFKEAYNHKEINASIYLDFDADFKLFRSSAGKPGVKKEIVKRLQKLYKDNLYNK